MLKHAPTFRMVGSHGGMLDFQPDLRDIRPTVSAVLRSECPIDC